MERNALVVFNIVLIADNWIITFVSFYRNIFYLEIMLSIFPPPSSLPFDLLKMKVVSTTFTDSLESLHSWLINIIFFEFFYVIRQFSS